MDSHKAVYERARALLADDPEALLAELDRTLRVAAAPPRDRLDAAVRLAELALVAVLDPWWTGPSQPNVRRAIRRVPRSLHDPVALGIALRLGCGYALQGRVDDETHLLARQAARLTGTGLPEPDATYARRAAAHLEQALFVPSGPYVYDLVRGQETEAVCAEAAEQLGRGNASFAAQLAELSLVRSLADWFVGPGLPNVERALKRYASTHPEELQETAVLLARAYVKGGFVDLRARDHVQAVLEGPEAQLLGPDEAIGLQDYVDRGCFDVPYAVLYDQARGLAPDALRDEVRRLIANGALTTAQRLCEMVLVRAYADWYVGDPTSNVRNAIAKFLADEDAPPDPSWAGHTLAGLYAATLDGSPHARRLVQRTFATFPDAPPLLEAAQAAGIPPDVSASELLDLYVSVVDIDAKVQAFRALAEESGGGLSDYEQRAYGEVLRFLEEGEASLVDELTATLGDLAEVALPDVLLRSATAGVEDVLRLALGGASATLRRERIVSQLAQRDPALRSLDRIRDAQLELLDEVAWSLTIENRVIAALEGLGCGLGGATLILVDVPMLILVNLNAVATVATTYGFDIDDPGERDFAVALLAGGVEALGQAVAGAGDQPDLADAAAPRVGRLTTARAALALHATAARIAARLARRKLIQLLPVLGGAVGAGLNFHYTHTTVRTAVMAYRYRWLVRRFEG